MYSAANWSSESFLVPKQAAWSVLFSCLDGRVKFPRPMQTHWVIFIPGNEEKSFSSKRPDDFKCNMYDCSIAGTTCGGKSSVVIKTSGRCGACILGAIGVEVDFVLCHLSLVSEML